MAGGFASRGQNFQNVCLSIEVLVIRDVAKRHFAPVNLLEGCANKNFLLHNRLVEVLIPHNENEGKSGVLKICRIALLNVQTLHLKEAILLHGFCTS